MADLMSDMGGYAPWLGDEDRRLRQGVYGGVMDKLGLSRAQGPAPAPRSLWGTAADKLGQGLSLIDHYAMGIPSTMAGLVNSAIPGQPLGDMWAAKSAADDARSELAQNPLGRDLLALPEAYAGMVPGGVGHAAAKHEIGKKPSVFGKEIRGNDGQKFSILQQDPSLYVVKDRSGNSIGRFETSSKDDGAISVVRSHVEPDFQRNGIASGFYDYLAAETQREGGRLVPDMNNGKYQQTPDGAALWKSRGFNFDDGTQGRRPTTGGDTPNASVYADLFSAAARQAGRAAESLIDPVYNAMPSNAAGIFGGKLAKTADQAALTRAEEMTARGVPREQVWQDTGWFRGVDGKWRFEIDDSGANWRYGDDSAGPLSNKFSHRDLMKAYPDLTDARLSRDGRGGDGAYIAPFAGKPETFAVGGVDDTRRTLLHEIQHGLQSREDFAPGSSPFTEVMLERTGKITDGSYAGDRYQRSAGEVEARTVQKRMDLTADERRSRPPWEDYDVPEDQQIVRFGGSGPQMSAPPSPPPGITAYHGSPHDFDRFDMSKIGTGEGAQAYGHGLYFAESEGVAKSYRDGLSQNFSKDAARARFASILKDIDEMQASDPSPHRIQLRKEVEAAMAEVDNIPTNGRMYEVRINADPNEFLDWDRPLSQQSEKVRGALSGLIAEDKYYTKYGPWDEPNKPVSYYLPASSGRAVTMADQLKERGVSGIRYLDQGSRTAGEGSRNYVVFRDDIISIVKKYGIAAAASMYGMDQVSQAMAVDQPQQNALAPY